MKTRIASIASALLVAGALAADAPSVLPEPQKMVVGAAVFKLAPETRIFTESASRAKGHFLATQLRQSTGYKK